jgi:hypothetical protein
VILFTLFGFIYLAVALTIGVTTYRKGRKVLFFIGFLMPALWLVGAIMPAKKGSRYEHQEEEHWQKESEYSHSAHHRSG